MSDSESDDIEDFFKSTKAKKPAPSFSDSEEDEGSDWDQDERINDTKNASDSDAVSESESGGDSGDSFGLRSSDDESDASSSDIGSDSESDEGSIDEYGADLMGDDEDRRKLAEMNEMERENVLNERYNKREEAKERREAKKSIRERKKLQKKQEKLKKAKEKADRRSKPATTKEKNMSVLARARKDREKQKKASTNRRKAPVKTSASSTRANNKRRKKDSSDSGSGSESSDEESGSGSDGDLKKIKQKSKRKQSYRDRKKAPAFELDLAVMESLKISRSQLEKWVDQPFLEDTCPGCYVRINIGLSENKNSISSSKEPVCRMVEIDKVERSSREYQFGGLPCNKYLICRFAKETRKFAMKYVSNGPFTAHEYRKWQEEMEKENCSLPRQSFVKKKLEDLHVAKNYICTSEDIKKIADERKKMNRYKVKNYTIEKHNLETAISKARDANDSEKVAELEAALEDVVAKEVLNYQKHRSLNLKVSGINELARKRNLNMNLNKAFEARYGTQREEAAKFRNSNKKKADIVDEKVMEAEIKRRQSVAETDVFQIHNFDLNYDFPNTPTLKLECQASASLPKPNNLFGQRLAVLTAYKEKHDLL